MEGLLCGFDRRRHRLSGAGLAHVLDAGDQVAHLAGAEVGQRDRNGRAGADLVGLVGGAGLHEPELGAGGDGAVHHPDGADDAPVLVVVGVEDERSKWGVGVALWGGDALHGRVEQLGDAGARLAADAQDGVGVDAEHLLDLPRHPFGLGEGQVDLVDRGHDLQVVLHGLVAGGQGLGLDALGGVHQQDGPLAGGQRPRHLVAEVHVARGVDEVDDEVPPLQPDVLGLDRDAPLALQVHGVEVLGPHVTGVDGAGELEDAVGQRGLPVVDVADDGEVADARRVDHGSAHCLRSGVR